MDVIDTSSNFQSPLDWMEIYAVEKRPQKNLDFGLSLLQFLLSAIEDAGQSQPIPAIPPSVTHSFSEMAFPTAPPHCSLHSPAWLKYRAPVGISDLLLAAVKAFMLQSSGSLGNLMVPQCLSASAIPQLCSQQY